MSNIEEGHLHTGNCHCVYNITSNMGYVNLSVTQLTYFGIYYKDVNINTMYAQYHCQGGTVLKCSSYAIITHESLKCIVINI